MKKPSAPSVIAAVALTAFVASCSPSGEEEFDQYEAMERLSTADLIGELVDRAAINHWTKRSVTEASGGIFLGSLSDQPSFDYSNNAKSNIGFSEDLAVYLGKYKDFVTLFQRSHDGDPDASLAISHFYAQNAKAQNLVLAMMYLKLASAQGAEVMVGDFENLSSQMSTLEIGLAEEAFALCRVEGGVVEGSLVDRVVSDCRFRDFDGKVLDIFSGNAPNP